MRGDNVTRGYYNAPEETRAAFQDGWFHTGDIGEIDAQGQLHIRGRKKEMIVTPEGLNVFPEDVERALNAQPGVKDSAVVGASAPGCDCRARACGAGRRARSGRRRDRPGGQRHPRRSPEDPRRGGVARRGAAANGRHAQTEAPRAARLADRAPDVGATRAHRPVRDPSRPCSSASRPDAGSRRRRRSTSSD